MVSVPALVTIWASTFHVINLYVPAPCQAFVPSTIKLIHKDELVSSAPINGNRGTPCFLGSTDVVVGSSTADSIDEIESRISAMKVVELKAELKSHSQPVSGLKKILQERLMDFYRAEMTNLEEESIGDSVDIEEEEDVGEDQEQDNEPEREFITFEIGKDETGFITYETEEDGEDFGSDNDIDTIDDQENDLLPSGLLESKQKWKKKTFLLMQDAQKLVHSKNPMVRKRGPGKAREAVRRIHRWIALSDATSTLDSENEFEAYYDDVIEEEDDDDDVDIGEMDSNSAMQFRAFQRSTLLRAYNIWIHAIAKSGDDDAGYQAEQVLKEMQQNVSVGGPKPDEVTIASVMDAHAHSATVSTSKSGAKAAEAFLFELLEKNEASDVENDMPWSNDGSDALRDSLIVTCDTMLNAWAREGTMESAERAQLILLRLEEYQRQREQKRIKTNASRTTTSATKRPISYATVMNAYANVGSTEAAFQAEATLEDLVQRAKVDERENKNQDEQSRMVLARPDTIVFNSVIQCWATSGDIRAGKKSERLLEQMKELAGMFDTHPDIITYNTVISAWSRSGDKNAAPRAEKIVKDLMMETQDTSPTSIVANTITFNTVLSAWSKSKLEGATDRAEKLLQYMIQSDNSEIKPDVYSFTCVMDTWAKSKEPNKASRAQKLLHQLLDMRQNAFETGDRLAADALKPSQIPYNTVLNACAFSATQTGKEEQKEAIQIAVNTFKSMSPLDSPSGRNRNQNAVSRDSVSYGLMIKAIANLMPRGEVRSRMALQVFEDCCDDGLVGYLVWNEIRRAVPPKLVQEACRFKRQVGSMEVKDLPKAWTSNCKERRSSKHQQRDKEKHRHKKNRGKRREDSKKGEEEDTTFIIERSFATGKDM